ncbi:class I SAM-dependent methyltransferase [Photobacterium sp. ZSDE20]|nr:class I SAM-dependent methyltransferase [Photobacterium sp. ZSDE20]
MAEQYNDEVSRHYAAYRPPIHQEILGAAFTNDTAFKLGLDIGCGTGVSSEALIKFCSRLVGIDPSSAMLAQANNVEGLSYLQGTGDNIPLDNNSVDVVSFAGSLSYAKSEALIDEIVRVCRNNAWVIAYDFEVLLDDHLESLGVTLPSRVSTYNHAENFEGSNSMVEQQVSQGTVTLEVSSEQLAHVLFSSSRRYTALSERYGPNQAFGAVVSALSKISESHMISVNTYFSTYRVNVSK